MKLLFLSDLQLEAGAPLGTGEYGPGSRFHDQVLVLERIAQLAYDENVEVVGCLGDVFERSRPSPWAILAFQQFVRALRAVDINVLVLQGNHDCRSAALPTALSIFGDTGVDIALTPSLYPLYGDDATDHADPDVVIAALPWTPISRLVAARPNLSRGQLNDLAAAALAESAQVLGARCYDEYPNACPILVGHWAISGATLPTGLPSEMMPEPVIPLEGLTSAGFRAIFFGHLHQVQVLAQDPPAVYCGDPQVVNWGEGRSQHGVWLYDTEGEGKLSFKQIEDRPFVMLEPTFVEIPGVGMAFSEPPTGPLAGALVRVKYTVDEETDRKIDQSKIRADLLTLGARKVFIKATVERAARARVAEVAEGIDDSAAFEMWLATQSIPEADLQALRDLNAGYEEAARG